MKHSAPKILRKILSGAKIVLVATPSGNTFCRKWTPNKLLFLCPPIVLWRVTCASFFLLPLCSQIDSASVSDVISFSAIWMWCGLQTGNFSQVRLGFYIASTVSYYRVTTAFAHAGKPYRGPTNLQQRGSTSPLFPPLFPGWCLLRPSGWQNRSSQTYMAHIWHLSSGTANHGSCNCLLEGGPT